MLSSRRVHTTLPTPDPQRLRTFYGQGSQFDVTSGALLRGPAETAVRSRRTEVQGEDLLVEI